MIFVCEFFHVFIVLIKLKITSPISYVKQEALTLCTDAAFILFRAYAFEFVVQLSAGCSILTGICDARVSCVTILECVICFDVNQFLSLYVSSMPIGTKLVEIIAPSKITKQN